MFSNASVIDAGRDRPGVIYLLYFVNLPVFTHKVVNTTAFVVERVISVLNVPAVRHDYTSCLTVLYLLSDVTVPAVYLTVPAV